MDQVPWATLGPWSGWAAFLTLAFLVLRAVVKGDWIPRVTHEREVTRADHDANEWRAEGRIKDQAILVELESIKKTGEETGSTVHNFIASLQKVTEVTPRPPQPEQPGGS